MESIAHHWFRFLHSFFCTEAALEFPNKNAEVRLSAPVFFDSEGGPAKTI
jgi:hypothetical protein